MKPATIDRPGSPVSAPPWRVAAAAAIVVTGGALLALWFANPYRNPDSFAFDALARSLMAGHGLVYREPMLPGLDLRAFRSPGYAAFLAATLTLGGVRLALAIQGALAGLTSLLWAWLAGRVAGPRAGLVTAAGALGLGLAWRFAGELMTETLYAALLVSSVVLAQRMTERVRSGRPPGAAATLALGVTMALAVLTRPSGVALVLASAAVALFSPATRRALLPALLVALVLWSAWPLRNARVLGSPVPTLTSGGINAWQGTTARPIDEGWRIASGHVSLGELGLDRLFWNLARAEAIAHPAAFLARLLHKARDYALPPSPYGGQWTHALLWGPALVGAGSLLRRATPWRAALALPLAVWTTHALLAMLTVSNDRYRFPTDGIVLLLGALGIETLLRRPGGVRGALAVAACMVGGLGLALLRHAAV